MRVVRLFALVLFAIHATSGLAWSNSELSVGTGEYRFTLDETPTTIVTLTPGGDWTKATRIELVVMRIRRNDASEADLMGSIRIDSSIERNADGLFIINPLLELKPNFYQRVGTYFGTYQITLLATVTIPDPTPDNPNNTKPLSETLIVSIVYPKLELETPKGVLIEETCFMFGFSCATSASKLSLEAKGMLGPIGLRAVLAQNGLNGGKSVPGELEITEPSGRQPVQRLSVNLAADGVFPLGETTGAIRVTSPETDRLSVNFKVTRKDSDWAIAIMSFIGLLLGYGLRTVLARKIGDEQRELTLKTSMHQVLESGRGIEDSVLQNELDKIRDEIRQELNSQTKTSGVTLNATMSAWETSLKKAVDTSATRSQGIEGKIDKLHNLVRGAWSLQEPISQELVQMSNDIEVVRESHRRRQLDTAESELGKLQVNLHGSLIDGIETWHPAVADQYAYLSGPSAQLPDGTVPDLAPITTALFNAINDVRAQLGNDRNADLLKILNADQAAVNAVIRQIYKLRRDVDSAAGTVVVRLGDHLGDLDAHSIEAARAALAALDPDGWTQDLASGDFDLVDTFRLATGAMGVAIRTVADGLLIDVREDLNAGKYGEAALKARTAADAKRAKESGQSVSGTRLADTDPDAVPSWLVPVESSLQARRDFGRPSVRSSGLATRPVWTIEQLTLDIQGSVERIRYIKEIQTGVAGVILTGAAVLIFSGSFAGTFDDYLKVFMWGFVTDVGVNNMLTIVRDKAKPV